MEDFSEWKLGENKYSRKMHRKEKNQSVRVKKSPKREKWKDSLLMLTSAGHGNCGPVPQ